MRRLVTAVVVAAMVALSACGRQVTGLNDPNGGGVAPSGQTWIRFETAGPLDFQNYAYFIVVNTSGNNVQPYASSFNSNFLNWSAYFIVGGGQQFANAPGLEQIYQNPATGSAASYNVTVPAGTLTFLPNIPTANAPYGFQLQINRCLLDLQPPSGNTPTPVTTNRKCPPYVATGVSNTWAISFFSLDKNLSPVDSLSVNGPNSTSQPPVLIDTSTVINNFQYNKPASNSTVQSTSAQITGVEIFNTP